jgi:tRNA(adenine34) deaminase
MFSQIDKNFMRIALNEAENCYKRGDLPVGAVLSINGNLEGIAGNSAKTNGDWTSHAENSLLHNVSWKIKQKKGHSILYTTWESCLMCTGASVLSRVNEIVYACPDFQGGMSRVDPSELGPWNYKHWPIFREGPFGEESYQLLRRYMIENSNIWGNFLKEFQKITL